MNVAAVPQRGRNAATSRPHPEADEVRDSPLRSFFAFIGATFLWIQVGLAAIAAICAVAVGQRPVVITGDSMTPAVSRGDVIVIDEVEPATLRAGQLVMFDIGEGKVTHRIVGFDDNGDVITKGDANAINDTTPVPRHQIIGRARVIVPALGLPIVWVQDQHWTKLILWLAFTALAILIVLGKYAKPTAPVATATPEPTPSPVPTAAAVNPTTAVPAVRTASLVSAAELKTSNRRRQPSRTNQAPQQTPERDRAVAGTNARTISTIRHTEPRHPTPVRTSRRTTVPRHGARAVHLAAAGERTARRTTQPHTDAAARRVPAATIIVQPPTSTRQAPPFAPPTATAGASSDRPGHQVVSFAAPQANQLRFRIPLPRNRDRSKAQRAEQHPPIRSRKE